MSKFSVVIPVYNTGEYLKRCIQSVNAQTLNDWEVILIDDGSIDDSAKICTEIAKNNSKVSFYQQKNRGQLATRQRGIQCAQGEFMLFLDSDDTWVPNLLETVNKIIEEYDSDIVLFRCRIIRDGKHLFDTKKAFEDRTVFGEDKKMLIREILLGSSLNSVATKAVRRSLALQCIEDDESSFSLRQSEDLLQTIKWFEKAKNIVYTDAALYNYIPRIGSASKIFRPEKYMDMLYVREAVKQFAIRMGVEDEDMKLFDGELCFQIIKLIEETYLYCKKKEDVRPIIRNIYEHPLIKAALKNIGLGSRAWPVNIKISFYLFKKRYFRLLELWMLSIISFKSMIRRSKIRQECHN